MEILRIPSAYYSQIEYLSKDDAEYILKTIFAIASGKDIKFEKSMRGGLAISIWREAVQMENKARAKKGEKRLKEDFATLSADTDDTLGSLKDATKSSQINSSQVKSNQNNIISKEITETSSELIIDKRDSSINEMQDYIKKEVENVGYIYKAGKYERGRIQNILTGKDINEIAEKHNMTIYEFVGNIFKLSTQLDFWNGKINNAETFYKHYANIYNAGLSLKRKKQSEKYADHENIESVF